MAFTWNYGRHRHLPGIRLFGIRPYVIRPFGKHPSGNRSQSILSPARFSREDWFLLCFFAGILAGAIAANIFFPTLKDQAAYYVGLLQTAGIPDRKDIPALFAGIFRQRMVELLIAWLIGLTIYKTLCYSLLAGGFGLSLGVILSVMTALKGILGLPIFLLTVFPQMLFYLPAWALLILWGVGKYGRLRSFSFIFLLFLLAAGSGCEAWLNPYFLHLLG